MKNPMKIKILPILALCGVFSIANLHAACGGPECSKDSSCSSAAKQCSAGKPASSKCPKGGKWTARKMIKKFDVDGSGNLDGNELVAMAQCCHDKHVAKQIGSSSASPKSVQLEQVEPFNAKHVAAEALVKFDKNGNGSLSPSELKVAMDDYKSRCKDSSSRCPKDECSDESKKCAKGNKSSCPSK